MELGFLWLCVFTTIVAAAAPAHLSVSPSLPTVTTSTSSPRIRTPLSASTTYLEPAFKRNLDSGLQELQQQLVTQKRLESHHTPIFRSTIDRGSPIHFPTFLSRYRRIPVYGAKKTVSNRKTKDTEDEHSEAVEKLTDMFDDIVHNEENNRVDYEAETQVKNKPLALTLAHSKHRSQYRHNKHQNSKRTKQQKTRDDEKKKLKVKKIQDDKKKLAEKKLVLKKIIYDYYSQVRDYLRSYLSDLLPNLFSGYKGSGEEEETRVQEWLTRADDSFAPEEYEPSFSDGEDEWK